jgi:hypothetical protein
MAICELKMECPYVLHVKVAEVMNISCSLYQKWGLLIIYKYKLMCFIAETIHKWKMPVLLVF